MKRGARVGCCLSWALATCTQTVSLAHAANLAPRDFAYGQPIVSPAAASAYSITLPLAIYQATVRDDLGDLAIFNARGEVVPSFISQARTDAGWSGETAQAREDARGDYVFDLDGHVPVERVDLRLAEANSVIAAHLYSRKDLRDAWKFVARGRFYRIHTPRGDDQSEPLAVPLRRDRYWLARIPNPVSASDLVMIAAWRPSELVFLAQGDPPFLLAYGSASATATRTDLTPFIAAVAVSAATLANAEKLGGVGRLAPAKPPFPWRRCILWLVLVGALAALGYMAARLLAETDRPPPPS